LAFGSSNYIRNPDGGSETEFGMPAPDSARVDRRLESRNQALVRIRRRRGEREDRRQHDEGATAAWKQFSLNPATHFQANSGFPPFQGACVCMPLPLSSKIRFGMNVHRFALAFATFLQMYLYHMN